MSSDVRVQVVDDPTDPLWRLGNLYVIRDKQRRRRKLRFNTCQDRILSLVADSMRRRLPIRHYDLKYRQGGVSTFWALYYLDDTIFTANTISGIVAQKNDTLGHLWDIVRFAHQSMPDMVRPPLMKDNTRTLAFPNGSKIFVSLKVQSTTLHNLHVSEYPLCDPDEIEQTLAAVPKDANITLEGVADGPNHAKEKWFASGDGWTRLFHPWYIQEEYRDKEPVPETEWTQDEKKLAAKCAKEGVALDGRQVAFRRRIHRELKRLSMQEFAEDPLTCFLSSGYPYFDLLKIHDIEVKAFGTVGREGPFHDRNGRECWETEAWEEPQPGHRYAAGADVAEGALNDKGDPDYSVLTIICVTCRQTAFRYRARIGVDAFYRVCDRYGREYNNALLAVERNNHGHAVLLGLRETSKYPKLYCQEPIQRAVTVGKPPVNAELTYGWDTTVVTKPLMLDQLKQLVEGKSEEDVDHYSPELAVHDTEFLHEAFSFMGDKGKLKAGPGRHDDVVMSLAIAAQMYLRLRASSVFDPAQIHVGNQSESQRLFGQR